MLGNSSSLTVSRGKNKAVKVKAYKDAKAAASKGGKKKK